MSTVNFKHENGDVLKDKVSGFEGVVMVRAEYSTGCHRYGLQSMELKDGSPQDWYWLDQSRLEFVESSAVTFDIEEGTTSGAFPAGPQS
jgi:hypothetical protein